MRSAAADLPTFRFTRAARAAISSQYEMTQATVSQVAFAELVNFAAEKGVSSEEVFRELVFHTFPLNDLEFICTRDDEDAFDCIRIDTCTRELFTRPNGEKVLMPVPTTDEEDEEDD